MRALLDVNVLIALLYASHTMVRFRSGERVSFVSDYSNWLRAYHVPSRLSEFAADATCIHGPPWRAISDIQRIDFHRRYPGRVAKKHLLPL